MASGDRAGSAWRNIASAATPAILRPMPSKLKMIAFLALGVVAAAIEFFQRGNLAEPIPLPLTLMGAAAGAFLGYVAASTIRREKQATKHVGTILVLLTMPVFGLFFGTLLARSVFLQAAFVNVASASQVTSVSVESRQTSSGRKSWFGSRNYWLNVSLSAEGRTFRVLVDRALYEKVGPKPAPRLHCLRLTVENGRWGSRRVLAPNHIDPPLGLKDYRRC